MPDDDLVSDNCVEEFNNALEAGELDTVNVVTIPSITINATGEQISVVVVNPVLSNNHIFYLRQLKGEALGSSLGDNIFRRSALDATGGFIDFPRGTHSDHATVLAASAGTAIYCIQRARFFFRQSAINISSQTDDAYEKLGAKLSFLYWIKSNANIFDKAPEPDFYLFIYFKAEHYFLHVWPFDYKLIPLLYKLRVACTNSKNIIPIFSAIARKLMISFISKIRSLYL